MLLFFPLFLQRTKLVSQGFHTLGDTHVEKNTFCHYVTKKAHIQCLCYNTLLYNIPHQTATLTVQFYNEVSEAING